MIRVFAVMCVLPAAVALGDFNYTADNRFCRAQIFNGQDNLVQPNPPFSPFHNSAQASSSLANGNSFAHSAHDSVLQFGSMSGSGGMNSNVVAAGPPTTSFVATGSSAFNVSFTVTSPSNLSLSGTIAGTAGKSNLQVRLGGGATVYFLQTAAGSFVHDQHLVPGTTYTLVVSASCTASASYTGTPVTSASDAAFNFVAKLVGASCTCDLNGDNVVDDSDFVLFASAYDMFDCTDPAMPAGCPADFNRDHFVDDTDFVLFATAYDTFVCPN